MSFSIRAIIRALVAPKHRLSCSSRLWTAGLRELARRGEGRHESGAFLLGTEVSGRRRITRFAYYDDFDPTCLETGIVVFSGGGYGPLWQLCAETGLHVVADVHTHGGRSSARQSTADRNNPMVATVGHVALIVPAFAQPPIRLVDMGVYEYLGAHRWQDYNGPGAQRFIYIGWWG